MPQRMEHSLWLSKYGRMRDIADRVAASRVDRARVLCAAAGLDPNLLGIHPHNAMVSAEYGKPWPEVDYSKVRACLRVCRMPSPYAIIDRWDHRVRIDAQQQGE